MKGRCGALTALGLLVVSSLAAATGIGLGTPFYLIDLSAALGKAPGVAASALAALAVPESDAAAIQADFEQALVGFPTVLPIPLLGGSLEIPLPFDLVDTLRLTAGTLNDGLLRGVASLLGTEIPEPLVELEWDEPGFEGAVTADLAFTTTLVSIEAMKRLDLVFLGLDLGLGLSLVTGEVVPTLDYDVPSEYQSRVAAAVQAVHADGLTWSSLGACGLLGLELGPPFLRLGLEGRVYVPFVQASGWWGIEIGDWAGALCLWVRF